MPGSMAEGIRSLATEAAKKAREVGGVAEAEMIRQMADTHVCINQASFGFQHHTLVNHLQRRLPCQFPAQGIEMHIGEPDAMSKGIDAKVLAVMLLYQLDEVAKHVLIAFAKVAW